MKLEFTQIQWSPRANLRMLAQHERAIKQSKPLLESTLVVAVLDLDDEEWADFTTNLTGFRLWLEAQGGNGTQGKVTYRKAVKVSGPDRTIYIDPQGGAHARFVGFPQEEPCPVRTPASPAKNSRAKPSGGKASRPRTRSQKDSSVPSAAKSGANTPTAAAPATKAAATTATEPPAPAEATTAPAAPPAPKPQDSNGTPKNTPSGSNKETAGVTSPPAVDEAETAKRLENLFELIDDDSCDGDW